MKSRLALLCAALLATCVSAPDLTRSASSSSSRRAAKPFVPEVIAPGQGKLTGYPGGGMTLLFQGRAGTDEISVIEVVVPPRSLGAPPHLHHNEDEYFYVVEGELTFLVGNEEKIAVRGTYAALPRELRHGYWNGSDAPARVLVTIAPGQFGQFFLDVAKDLEKRAPQQIGPLIAEHAKRYGCDVYLDQIAPIAKRYKLR